MAPALMTNCSLSLANSDSTFAPATGSWAMPYISGPTIWSFSFSNGVPWTALRARVFFSTRRYSPDFLAFDLSCVTRPTSRPRYSATMSACAPFSLAATSETIACFCSRLRPKVYLLASFNTRRPGIRNAVCAGSNSIKPFKTGRLRSLTATAKVIAVPRAMPDRPSRRSPSCSTPKASSEKFPSSRRASPCSAHRPARRGCRAAARA